MYFVVENFDGTTTGFFLIQPEGAFNIGKGGRCWVTNDLATNQGEHSNYPIEKNTVAPSALIQGF